MEEGGFNGDNGHCSRNRRKRLAVGLNITDAGGIIPPFLAATATVGYNRCDFGRDLDCCGTDAETCGYKTTPDPG
jgi:hypothetical protein